MSCEIRVGSQAEVLTEFHRFDDSLVNPTALTARFIDPLGGDHPVTPSSVSLGVYSMVSPVLTIPGRWIYEITGTGAVNAFNDGWFQVTPHLVSA